MPKDIEFKVQIYDGALDVAKIYAKWYSQISDKNLGAFVSFAGIVRDEDGIDGLSFDIHPPLLESWYQSWVERVAKDGAFVLIAHSKGDVLNHQSSYLAAVVSKQRKVALKLINEFVEDFKANAPIWKYDLRDGKRIYAKDRSQKLKNAGILS